MTQRWLELAFAFSAAFVILGIAHYLCTWKLVGGRRVKPPWTYVAGVFILMLVFAALEWHRGRLGAVLDFAAVAAGGGLAVGGGYHLLGDKCLREENQDLRAALGKMGRGDDERSGQVSDHRSGILGRKDQGAQSGD